MACLEIVARAGSEPASRRDAIRGLLGEILGWRPAAAGLGDLVELGELDLGPRDRAAFVTYYTRAPSSLDRVVTISWGLGETSGWDEAMNSRPYLVA